MRSSVTQTYRKVPRETAFHRHVRRNISTHRHNRIAVVLILKFPHLDHRKAITDIERIHDDSLPSIHLFPFIYNFIMNYVTSGGYKDSLRHWLETTNERGGFCAA